MNTEYCETNNKRISDYEVGDSEKYHENELKNEKEERPSNDTEKYIFKKESDEVRDQMRWIQRYALVDNKCMFLEKENLLVKQDRDQLKRDYGKLELENGSLKIKNIELESENTELKHEKDVLIATSKDYAAFEELLQEQLRQFEKFQEGCREQFKFLKSTLSSTQSLYDRNMLKCNVLTEQYEKLNEKYNEFLKDNSGSNNLVLPIQSPNLPNEHTEFVENNSNKNAPNKSDVLSKAPQDDPQKNASKKPNILTKKQKDDSIKNAPNKSEVLSEELKDDLKKNTSNKSGEFLEKCNENSGNDSAKDRLRLSNKHQELNNKHIQKGDRYYEGYSKKFGNGVYHCNNQNNNYNRNGNYHKSNGNWNNSYYEDNGYSNNYYKDNGNWGGNYYKDNRTDNGNYYRGNKNGGDNYYGRNGNWNGYRKGNENNN